MKDLTIRLAENKDIEEVGKLWIKMVKELNPEHTPNIDWWHRLTGELLKTEDTYYLTVAEKDNTIIGFLDALKFYNPTTGKLHGIGQSFYVLPEHRNAKISVKIYKFVLNIAKEQHIEILELITPLKDFWKKKGYNETTKTMVKLWTQ